MQVFVKVSLWLVQKFNVKLQVSQFEFILYFLCLLWSLCYFFHVATRLNQGCACVRIGLFGLYDFGLFVYAYAQNLSLIFWFHFWFWFFILDIRWWILIHIKYQLFHTKKNLPKSCVKREHGWQLGKTLHSSGWVKTWDNWDFFFFSWNFLKKKKPSWVKLDPSTDHVPFWHNFWVNFYKCGSSLGTPG